MGLTPMDIHVIGGSRFICYRFGLAFDRPDMESIVPAGEQLGIMSTINDDAAENGTPVSLERGNAVKRGIPALQPSPRISHF